MGILFKYAIPVKYGKKCLFWGGSGPDRERSSVEWGDFLLVCFFVCSFVCPPPPPGHPARPSQPGLRPRLQSWLTGPQAWQAGTQA